MTAEKGNKVYKISESEKARYIAEGFDIFDESRKKISSGSGKTVSVEEYDKLKQENEKLKQENAALGEEIKDAENNSDEEGVVDILKEYASEYQIDIGQARTVSGIVKKLKEQLHEKPEKAGE